MSVRRIEIDVPRNRELAPTYRRPLAEQALQVMLTGTLSSTFYVGREALLDKAVQVLSALCAQDPEVLARLVVYAREVGAMRIVPVLGLLVLSGSSRTDLFGAAFERVIRTPRDLRDFLVLARTSPARRGLGRAVKRAIGRFLLGLSEYHLLKYGRAKGDFSLGDALRLARPRPTNARESALLEMIASGHRKIRAGLEAEFPQVMAYQQFHRASTREERLEAIAQGRLPVETVLGAVRPDVTLWRALVAQMPLLSLVRHLETLVRVGALVVPETLEAVCGRLRDADAVRAARVFPFSLYAALKAISTAEVPSIKPIRACVFEDDGTPVEADTLALVGTWGIEEVTAALRDAVTASMGNVTLPPGQVCVAIDVSGSMSSPFSTGSSIQIVEIAALIAAALHHQAPERAIIIPFQHEVVPFAPVEGADPLQVVASLVALLGGCTSLAAPVHRLVQERQRVDWFIGITDNEEWLGPNGRGFLAWWTHYREQVAPDAQACLLTLAPYRDAPVPPEIPGVHLVYGWSEDVVAHLGRLASGESQLEAALRHPSLPGLDLFATCGAS